MSSNAPVVAPVSSERAAELKESLAEVRARVQVASTSAGPSSPVPTLVAVSKLKPASDILTCYQLGQRDFGENYVQELQEKAAQLTLPGIRWHFIGTLQSNKAKVLATIPNIYAVQTITSAKAATALDSHYTPRNTASQENGTASHEKSRLNIYIQVNTSGEDAKSGLDPLTTETQSQDSELVHLALHVIKNCPNLRLQGLMTIGSLAESLSDTDVNRDFETLLRTRDLLQGYLSKELSGTSHSWGEDGRLLLSMGMSSDFETALKAGSDVVRVGTSIFGTRPKKTSGPS